MAYKRSDMVSVDLIEQIDSFYGISDGLAGNGCEHGFKPARSCPTHSCEERQIHLALWALQGTPDDEC